MKREGSSMKFPLSHPFPALENRTIPLFVKLVSDWLKLSPGVLLLVGSRRQFSRCASDISPLLPVRVAGLQLQLVCILAASHSHGLIHRQIDIQYVDRQIDTADSFNLILIQRGACLCMCFHFVCVFVPFLCTCLCVCAISVYVFVCVFQCKVKRGQQENI